MEPLAVAAYTMIAAHAVLAAILGAFAGAIAWAVRRNPLWAVLLAAGIYFAESVVLGSSRLVAAAVIGIPPLILTLLSAWLAARYLGARATFRRISATLLALCCALLLGFLWGFSFRLGLWVAVSLALAADACLIVLFYRAVHQDAPGRLHVR